MKIAVVKETRNKEQRVSITPEIAARLVKNGYEVVVEQNAGNKSGFPDVDYKAAGAKIAYNKEDLYKNADIVSWLKRPENDIDELKYLPKNAVIFGFLDPFKEGEHIKTFARKGFSTISLELLPQNSRTEKMDAFAAMGSVAGSIAYDNAKEQLPSNSKNLTILIIGSGNAGFAAAEKAFRNGDKIVVVSSSERNRSAIEKHFSGKFEVLPPVGYHEILKKIIKENQPDIIIAAARKYGEKAPILINRDIMKEIKPDTIIEDLTASIGGNTYLTKPDKIIKTESKVTVSNKSNYPSKDPKMASTAYAYCFYHIMEHVKEITKEGKNIIGDKILGGSFATHEGRINNTISKSQGLHSREYSR